MAKKNKGEKAKIVHRKMFAHSLNGTWETDFSFLRIKEKSQDKKGKKKNEWVAVDVLRRERIKNGSVENPRDPFNAMPRTLAGLIQLNRLELKLPTDELSILRIQFDKNSPEISCILDFPFDPSKTNSDDWHFIATGIEISILLESKSEWPSYLKVEIATPGDIAGNEDDDHDDDEKENKNRFQPITPKKLFGNYFGFKNIQKGDVLIFNPDGLTIQSRNQIPWKPKGEMLQGKFRFNNLQTSAGNYVIEIENDSGWLNSLRTFQTNVIRATEQIKNDNGMPTNNSPGLGLVSSALSRSIKWHLKKGKLSFIPDQTLFEGEIRGAAGATSRISFQEILIRENGQSILCKSGEKEGDNAHLNYKYSAHENLWSGQFEASIEHDSQELIAEISEHYGSKEDIVKAWIQTDTGALKLPLLQRSNISEPSNPSSSSSIFRGLVRLSEVPWVQESKELKPSPDVGQVKYSSLLLLNADSFEASFSFHYEEVEKEGEEEKEKLVCDAVDGKISEPHLRLEDFLPIYLPPKNEKNIYESCPPDLPLPVEEETDARDVHFVGLSLIRKKDLISGPSKPPKTSFNVSISYQPGASEDSDLKEGKWMLNKTEIIIPKTQVQLVEYWYRPASLKWIPSLPLYGDPRKKPEEAISAKRSYMPLGLGTTKASNIILSPGTNWQIPIIEGGFKVPFASGETASDIFHWVIPELPGIALVLLNDGVIRIKNGLPVGGNIQWIWRHDIPILDELNALRTTEDTTKNKDANTKSKSWLEQLKQLSLLTKSRAELLLEAELQFDKTAIIKAVDEAVLVQNLYNKQEFSGKASINVLDGTASLTLDSSEGDLQLISENSLLKGASTFMTANYEDAKGGFKLTPSADKNSTIKIEAGTLLPFHSEIDKKKVTVDHNGSISYAVENDKVGRQVMVYNEASKSLEKVFLWSHQEINLETDINQLALNFSGLPLCIEKDKWTYDSINEFLKNEQLRNFTWSTIGNVSFWGLTFQLFKLVRVEFAESQNETPSIPTLIHLEGVLHFRDANIKIADPVSQKIELTLLQKDGAWKIESFVGTILWPLFGNTPDFSSTSSNKADSYPLVSGPIQMERKNEKNVLTFSPNEEAMHVSFRFMERTWKLPVQLKGDTLKGIKRADLLEFKLISSEELPPNKLIAENGNFYLKRKDSTKDSNLNFRIQVSPDGDSKRSLLDLSLNLKIKKTENSLKLITVNVMSLDKDKHLVSLSASQINQIQLSPGNISLVINKKEGWQAGNFELLPGWKISNQVGLHGYISLNISDPPPTGDVSSGPLKTAQVVIETGVETPDLLSTVVSYNVLEDQSSNLSIELTGILKLQNLISWSGEENATLEHNMDLVLRQAQLKGTHLDTNGSAFFRPAYIKNSDDGLSGMIEIPCLVKHNIVDDKDETLLSWTAPQNIRLASSLSFAEEVLLRGNKKVESAKIFSKKQKKVKQSDYSFKDIHENKYIHISFEPSHEIEQGFVGALGDELAALIKDKDDLMIIDATEAFWLRPSPEENHLRSEIELWRQKQMALVATPSFHDDYDDSGKADSQDWYRLAMPFISETTGFIASESKASKRLNELLSNKRGGILIEDTAVIASQNKIPRSSLLSLAQLNQFSMDYQPAYSQHESGLDQVILDPSGFEKLVPYTSPISGFEPGWLSFRNWQLSGKDGLSWGIPFGSTQHILSHLVQSAIDKNLMAATELVPNKNNVSLPSKTKQGKAGTYFYMSPVLSLDHVEVPIKTSSHLLKQLSATPRIFIDWQGLKSEDELSYIPKEVVEKILEYVNNLSGEELRAKVPDAPGGYSKTEEGYGIGKLVIGRIKRITDNKPMSSLNQLLKIRGFGIDKISDLIYAVASELYDLEIDYDKFQEVRVQIEFWLPASGNSTRKSNTPLTLASKNIFLLGIEDGDDWKSILFPNGDTEKESKLQTRIWEWVAKETARLNSNGSPLLRATLLNHSTILGHKSYYLMDSLTRQGSLMKTKPQNLSVDDPMIPDLRLEFMEEAPLSDTMLAGPELLAGEVYYTPRDWSTPPEPILDNDHWAGIIHNVTITPAQIEKGETVTLNWKNSIDTAVKLSEKGKEGSTLLEELEIGEENECKLAPTTPTIYVLTLEEGGKIIDRYEVGINVSVPAAGSALGLNYKFTGIAPGMNHASRKPTKKGGYQNWVEMIRDLRFKDFTRTEESAVLESGELLPASRKISMDESAVSISDMNPFLAVRASHIFASGRPGGMMRFRTAMLTEDANGTVRRKGSWAHDIRYPRPVPLPVELYPFDPDKSGTNDAVLRPSCKVEPLHGAAPFTYQKLSWQDPIYNRRLHAVAQEKTAGFLSLGLDRSVYAGSDVCYPELKILDGIADGWTVEVKLKIQREIDAVPEIIIQKEFNIASNDTSSMQDPNAENRYVFEIGIGDIDLITEDDNLIVDAMENEDQLIVEANLTVGEKQYTVILNALIRTDKDVWSQPQNAFAVIRNEETELNKETNTRTEIAAFGWLPKPKIVKRKDRFRADSWEGTFRYQDVFMRQTGSEISYEIKSFTAYGEMML